MTITPANRFKRAVLLALLQSHPSVQVTVCTDADGVQLPERLMLISSKCTLELSQNFPVHPEVFQLEDSGVKVLLRFSGKEFLCLIPWESIVTLRALSAVGAKTSDEVFPGEVLPFVMFDGGELWDAVAQRTDTLFSPRD